MKMIVAPQFHGRDRACRLMTTMCALCSEDPRFCDRPDPGPIE